MQLWLVEWRKFPILEGLNRFPQRDFFVPVDLLIYMVIAAVLIFWLRNTLGTRHGDERDRSDIAERLMRRPEKDEDQAKDQAKERGPLLDLPLDVSTDLQSGNPETSSLMKGVKVAGSDAAHALIDLMRSLPGFDPHQFVTGASDAFAMIVEAFARGDLATLKDLLSLGVYSAFEQAIYDRRDRGETVQTDIHAVRTAEIIGVTLMEQMAFIKVRFIADETCVIRNRDGVILSGNPDKITTMNDVWTFGRDIRSKDPTWYLYETADDVSEDHKTPLPDSMRI